VSIFEVAALRIQQALEDTLDRHAGHAEAERMDALIRRLREEISALPADQRAPTVAALRTLQPADVSAATPTAPSARELELEDEVTRLRAALAAAQAKPVAMAGVASPALLTQLGKLLALPARELETLATGEGTQERLVSTFALLVDFALGLLRAYIPVTQDEDHTVAGLVQRLVADAVAGRSAGTDLATHVERTRRQVGGQVFAFRRACEEGGRGLLKALAPAVIEAEAAKQASFLEKRFGIAAQCWDMYGKRLEELRTAADLYQAYFDGPLRREMHRLAGSAEAQRAV
jgi:hypothetical protein